MKEITTQTVKMEEGKRWNFKQVRKYSHAWFFTNFLPDYFPATPQLPIIKKTEMQILLKG